MSLSAKKQSKSVLFSKEHQEKSEHASPLNAAIRSNRWGKDHNFNITYKKENGETVNRKVKPIFAKGHLLVAHDHHRDALRTFHIERIQKMEKAAFFNGFEKRAGEVVIPKGGLRPGLLTNDFTQMMSPDDAKRVKEKLPWYKRTGPGVLPMAVLGATVGSTIPHAFTGKGSYLSGKGAAIGGLLYSAIPYALTRAGVYDKSALRAAEKAIDESHK